MPRTNVSPRLSINQLANYLVATPTQRRRIIQNAKTPPTFLVNWYDFARQAIRDFIVGGLADEVILANEATRLGRLVPTNDYEETRYRTNAAALDAFLDCYEDLDLEGFVLQEAPATSTFLCVNNVEISVRPEFISSGAYRGQDYVGGLKLYFSKDDPLTTTFGSLHYVYSDAPYTRESPARWPINATCRMSSGGYIRPSCL